MSLTISYSYIHPWMLLFWGSQVSIGVLDTPILHRDFNIKFAVFEYSLHVHFVSCF